MRSRVSKWRNGLAIRLSQAAVESLQVHEGEQVELTIEGDRIEIRPARLRYRLEELVRQITPENQPEPIDVSSVGEELP